MNKLEKTQQKLINKIWKSVKHDPENWVITKKKDRLLFGLFIYNDTLLKKPIYMTIMEDTPRYMGYTSISRIFVYFSKDASYEESLYFYESDNTINGFEYDGKVRKITNHLFKLWEKQFEKEKLKKEKKISNEIEKLMR